MSYLEELLPEFRKGTKIRRKCWEDNQYVFLHPNGSTYLATGRLFKFDTNHILSDDWEFYQEPIDWNYIIKNKCLCWFWERSDKEKFAGLLTGARKDGLFDSAGYEWKNCRPVCKNEINFYEDRKDGI